MNSIQFGKNQFCGPSVISAICGIGTDEASAILSTITGQKNIKGVYTSDLIKAFNQLGYDCNSVTIPKGSLFSSLFYLHGKDGTYVFMVPGHFIAIELNGNHKFICDNHTKEPINVGSSSRLGMRVQSIFRIERRK